MSNGINLVGILTRKEHIIINERNKNFKDIFVFLTDKTNNIIHFTENCHTILNIPLSFLSGNIKLDSIFPSLGKVNCDIMENVKHELHLD